MSRRAERWIVLAFLFLLFTLQVTSIRWKAITFDEPPYITRGYAFVRMRDLHLLVGEPALLNALNALPLLPMKGIRIPVDDPAWQGTNFHPALEVFLWEANGDKIEAITFASRIPTVFLSLLLAVFVYRWAREAFGPIAGLAAIAICALDPNIIAHGRLAATDLGSAALVFISTYWIWRFLLSPSRRTLILSGIAFGLAQASRFSALVFGPAYALLFLLRGLAFPDFALFSSRPSRWRAWRDLISGGVVILIIGYATIWAVHAFQWGPIRGRTDFPVPAPIYWEELFYILPRISGVRDPVPGFLLGHHYVGGHWAYFPVAFVLKTPIPTLILGAVGIWLILRPIRRCAWRQRLTAAMLTIPPTVYFLFTLRSKLNLGYRYLLPILPFVIIWAGYALAHLLERAQVAASHPSRYRLAAILLIGWIFWSGLGIYPHYLAYFNELAGGPENGWRYLVDTNIDWGQDLKLLKRWMDQHGVETVKLAYYGEAWPSAYGINFDPLICHPDRWEHPNFHDLYPDDPAPGIYAISANLLQGRTLADPETYRWFRQRDPIDKIGYSIFIYDVPAHGQPATAVLSGLVPADLTPDDYALLGTNDVRVLWVNAERVLAFPQGGETNLTFVADGALLPMSAISPTISTSLIRESTLRDGRSLSIWQTPPFPSLEMAETTVWKLDAPSFQPGDPAQRGVALSLPLRIGPLELLGYQIPVSSVHPGDEIVLITFWRVHTAPTERVTLFVHLLGMDGTYRTGEDREDIWYANWQPGDRLVQVHRIAVPSTLSPGTYFLELGAYRPETLERYVFAPGMQEQSDRVLLVPVQVQLGVE